MPPLRQQNLRKLVRKLGENSQPGEQAEALAMIMEGCEDDVLRAAIVAFGGIPLLVQLLGSGSPAQVQIDAAGTLYRLAVLTTTAEIATNATKNVVLIAAAGAIPLLVALLKPGSPTDVQRIATAALGALAVNDETIASIVSYGAIPLLVQLLGPSSPVMAQVFAVDAILNLTQKAEAASSIAASDAIPLLVQLLDPGDGPPAMMQGTAAAVLRNLAENSEDAAVTIAAAGAIPLLVQLLKPGSGCRQESLMSSGELDVVIQTKAAGALYYLAANSENAVTIAAAGAIPPLARLSRSDADDVTKAAAAGALEAIRKGIAENRAAVAAAKASADLGQEMDGLGVDGPSDLQRC
jgi:hypothetical protein